MERNHSFIYSRKILLHDGCSNNSKTLQIFSERTEGDHLILFFIHKMDFYIYFNEKNLQNLCSNSLRYKHICLNKINLFHKLLLITHHHFHLYVNFIVLTIIEKTTFSYFILFFLNLILYLCLSNSSWITYFCMRKIFL